MLPIVPVLRRSANALVVLACLAFSVVFPACGEDSPLPPPPPPILLIVGVDNSQSFLDFNPFDLAVLDSLCKAITESGRGGTVAFQMIGKPTNQSPTLLRFVSTKDCDGLPASQRLLCEQQADKVKGAQTGKVNAFLAACAEALRRPRDTDTDLNGFFARAGRLCRQPQYGEHEKFLFLYSDGFHDVRKQSVRDTVLDCDLLPMELLAASICGWKNPEDCGFSNVFEAPGEFPEYFKQAIHKKTSSKK